MSSKLQSLPAVVTLNPGDVLYVVTNPGTTPTDNSITFSALQALLSSGGLTKNNVTTSTVTMVSNNSYLINNGASLCTLTLPASPAINDVVKVIGNSSGSWEILPAAGQTINFNSKSTTTSVTTTNQYNCAELFYAGSNSWTLEASGNLYIN